MFIILCNILLAFKMFYSRLCVLTSAFEHNMQTIFLAFRSIANWVIDIGEIVVASMNGKRERELIHFFFWFLAANSKFDTRFSNLGPIL